MCVCWFLNCVKLIHKSFVFHLSSSFFQTHTSIKEKEDKVRVQSVFSRFTSSCLIKTKIFKRNKEKLLNLESGYFNLSLTSFW